MYGLNSSSYSSGQSTLSGVLGQSTLSGQLDQSTLSGKLDQSTLSGLLGQSTLSGQLDQSTLSGLLGQSTLSGVLGQSTLSGQLDQSTLSGVLGQSTLYGPVSQYTLYGPVGQSTLSGNTCPSPHTSSISAWSTVTSRSTLRIDAENALKGICYASKFKDVLEYSDTETARLLVEHLKDWFQAEYNSTGAHDAADCLQVFTNFHREYSGGYEKSLRIFTRKNLWLKVLELKLYESRVFQRAMELVVWKS